MCLAPDTVAARAAVAQVATPAVSIQDCADAPPTGSQDLYSKPVCATAHQRSRRIPVASVLRPATGWPIPQRPIVRDNDSVSQASTRSPLKAPARAVADSARAGSTPGRAVPQPSAW